MLRALWFFILLGLLAADAMWLASKPGQVHLDWQGYQIDTSAAMLINIVVAIAVLSALLYRFWVFLRGVPAGVKRHRREGRRRRGYLALSRGMVAVAAGDASEAKRQAGRADGLLDEPSLTMLLAAQSAQLTGDEKAAQTFFTKMLNSPDTEFLGLRGLLNQAMKSGDRLDALKLARRASLLKPESEWVARTLFDLTSRERLWAEADLALAAAVRKKHLTPAEAKRPRAVLSYLMSQEAETSGEGAKALKLAKKACESAPDLIPAQAHLARLLKDAGKHRKAYASLENAWGHAPHPDLAAAYGRKGEADDPMARLKTAQKLGAFNPANPATSMMLAGAALDAGLWGEARKSLQGLVDLGEPVSNRYCQLMAELEEREHGDLARAREWLLRAANADPDPTWVCSDCGNAAPAWSPLCGGCGGFDTLKWHRPPRVPGLIGSPEESVKLSLNEDASEPASGNLEKLPPAKASQDIDAPSPSQ